MINGNINEVDDRGNLEKAFAQIGFDYKSMLLSARYVNNWTILLSEEAVFRYIQNNVEVIHFLFTVIRFGDRHEYLIHHIQATLLETVSNSNQRKIMISKDYWNYNKPFPTKEKIYDDITLMLNTSSNSEEVKSA